MKKCFSVFFFLALGCSSLVAHADSATDTSLVSVTSQEIPSEGSMGPLSLTRFNLNRQGNTIIARPGEKIFSTLNFFCQMADPEALYQVVIGYEDVGPQKCIFNELGYRFEGEEGIVSFFLEAPAVPGIYDVQCNVSSARSSLEAFQSWWEQKTEGAHEMVTVGRIIVK